MRPAGRLSCSFFLHMGPYLYVVYVVGTMAVAGSYLRTAARLSERTKYGMTVLLYGSTAIQVLTVYTTYYILHTRCTAQSG